MPTTTVLAPKVLRGAQPFLAPLAATTDAAAKAVLDEAVRKAASVDGDRCVDAFEAEAVRQAFDAVKPNGGALTLAEAQQVKSAVDARVAQLLAARGAATDVVFTSTGNAEVVFRQKILDSIDQTLARAAGRPCDVNVLLFAFTDKTLADTLADRAKNNPNLTIRVLTDWSDLADSGNRQAPKLARLNLPNLLVKFKADMPYVWSATRNGPSYSHTLTEGLNHHKGFVTLVDGRPEVMTLGSFNWSQEAMKDNYENLMVLDRKAAANRPAMAAYQKEFEGFWNDDKSALSYAEALRAREDAYEKLTLAHGGAYTKRPVTAQDMNDPAYAAVDNTHVVDLNSFEDADAAKLTALVGKTTAKKIWAELAYGGRFDSLEELMERVPDAAHKLTALAAGGFELGEGGLSLNTANAEELDRAGFSKNQANKLVAYRAKYGALESVDEALAIGISKARLEKIGVSLSVHETRGFFSARQPGGQATTGWAPENRAPVSVPQDPAAQASALAADPKAPANRAALEPVDANLAAPVIDMLRRAPAGETFRFAMYGVSDSSPEFKEMVAAAKRGVPVRAVLFDDYNDPAINALKALKAQGYDVDLKIISSHVMHQKFGVCGNDVWNGSANMSLSSITKHSEDRFYFRNDDDLAQKFVAEFDRLWALGH